MAMVPYTSGQIYASPPTSTVNYLQADPSRARISAPASARDDLCPAPLPHHPLLATPAGLPSPSALALGL